MSFLGRSVHLSGMASCDPRIWSFQSMQQFTSSDTSINDKKLPTGFTRGRFVRGTVNADIGGGRFDNGTLYLAEQGVDNVVFDPYNRSQKHNERAVGRICGGRATTATINNVLNVIREPEARAQVIERAYDALRAGGVAYFVIYEGSSTKSNPLPPKATSKGWQERRLAETYVTEIRRFFPRVERSGNMLIAHK